MRVVALLLLCLLAMPASAQITIGKYRISGQVEFDAEVTIEEIPMVTMPDPVAAWHFDDLTDSMGTYEPLWVPAGGTQNPPTFGAGKLGDAMYLDRDQKQYARLENSRMGVLKTDIDFTLTGWLWMDTVPVQPSGTHSIFATTDSGLSGGMIIFTSSGTNTLQFAQSTAPVALTQPLLAAQEWQFFAYRHDKDANHSKLRLINSNGDGERTLNTAGTLVTTKDLNIGNLNNSNTFPFEGRCDAFHPFDHYLTDEQVEWMYNEGNGRELPLSEKQASRPFASPVIAAFQPPF